MTGSTENHWEPPEIRDMDISDCHSFARQPSKCFETNGGKGHKTFASQVPRCKKKKKKPKPS